MLMLIMTARRPIYYVLLMVFVRLRPVATSHPHPPDTIACCRHKNLSRYCVTTLCNPRSPPGVLEVFQAAKVCSGDFPKVAKCLADERDHLACCKTKADTPDQGACFDMCQGSAHPMNKTDWDSHRAYMTCLSFNLRSMYQCFQDGYKVSPTPPKQVQARVTGATSADISWKAPGRFPELAKKYKVHYINENNMQHEAFTVSQTVESTFLTLEELQPDTKYIAYVVSYSADEKHFSQKSTKVQFVTSGVAPNTTSYRSVAHRPLGTKQSIACYVKVFGRQHRDVKVKWEKQGRQGSFFSSEKHAHKYKTTTYLSNRGHEQPKVYISTLTIKTIGNSDFGLYACVAKNKFGTSRTEIQLERPTNVVMPEQPPNTTACCERVGVNENCLEGCQSIGGRTPNVSIFLNESSCIMEFPKLLGCSMEGVDQGACCLSRHVPLHCLSFCDGISGEHNFSFSGGHCLAHTTAILACHREAKAALPQTPEDLRISSKAQTSATVVWKRAQRATAYHVYHRQIGSVSWESETVHRTEIGLENLGRNSAYELVVVAANVAGHSESSRSIYLIFGTFQRNGLPVNGIADEVSGTATGRLEEGLAEQE